MVVGEWLGYLVPFLYTSPLGLQFLGSQLPIRPQDHWLLPLPSGFWEEEAGKEALELAEGCQYLLLVPSTHPCLRVVIQHDYISRHNSKGRERKAIQLAGFNTHHVCPSKRRRKHEQSPTTPSAARGQPSGPRTGHHSLKKLGLEGPLQISQDESFAAQKHGSEIRSPRTERQFHPLK